jgi:UDP-N-acetylmuramoylalanine--D-glutamate ligase
VAVTGTNGKTTTTSLIHAMLAASGREIYLAGNIGKPLVELLTPEQISAPELRPRKDPFFPMVAELSSYQLESSVGLSPHVGVWLNLSENHLERHKTMERYLDAKARLFAGQRLKGDFAVISASDSYAPQMKKRVRVGTSHTFPFARWTGGQASVTRDTVTQDTVTHGEVPHGEATHCEVTHCEVTHGEATHGTDTSRQAALPHRGSFYDAESGVITFFYHGEVEEYSVKRSPLLGAHNKMNIAAAIPAARICGATPEEVQRTIDTFQPIEHRLEFVRELGGVAYINDTKATTVGAAAAALDALYSELPERRIVLLLGGQAKHGSWEPLRERLERSCFAAICFGGDGAKILTELQSPAALERCALSRTEALEEALSRATLLAQPGDIVLLSPGCASFDAYKNFEERGHHFKSLVAALQPPP